MKFLCSISLLFFNLLVQSQVSLPHSRTQWTTTVDGWTHNETETYSADCTNENTSCKFAYTGAWSVCHFPSSPDSLHFTLNGNSFSGGTFQVEQSINGTTWYSLIEFSQISSTCTDYSTALSSASRFIRFYYSNKVNGNVELDNVRISAGIDKPVINFSEAELATSDNEKNIVVELALGTTLRQQDSIRIQYKSGNTNLVSENYSELIILDTTESNFQISIPINEGLDLGQCSSDTAIIALQNTSDSSDITLGLQAALKIIVQASDCPLSCSEFENFSASTQFYETGHFTDSNYLEWHYTECRAIDSTYNISSRSVGFQSGSKLYTRLTHGLGTFRFKCKTLFTGGAASDRQLQVYINDSLCTSFQLEIMDLEYTIQVSDLEFTGPVDFEIRATGSHQFVIDKFCWSNYGPYQYYQFSNNDTALNYQTASNWSPPRETPLPSDWLEVSDSQIGIENFHSDTFAILEIKNNGAVELTTHTTATLVITEALFTDSNARLTLNENINLKIPLGSKFVNRGYTSINSGEIILNDTASILNNACLEIKSGSLINNGQLQITDGGALVQGTGSTLSGSGTEQIIRSVPNSNSAYHLWSTPIQDPVNIGELNATRQYQLNPPGTSTSDWQWCHDSDNMVLGKGYAFSGFEGFEVYGRANNDTITILSERMFDEDLESNVLGNPYPSAINAFQFCNTNQDIIDGHIDLFHYRPDLPYDASNQLITVNLLGANVNNTYTENQTLHNTNIASCQGFYVGILPERENLPILFTNAMRNDTNDYFKSEQSLVLGKFWIELSNADKTYSTLLGVVSEASHKIDWGWDVTTQNTGDFSVLTLDRDKQNIFKIQSIGPLTKTELIPVVISMNTTGNYQLSAVPSTSMNFGDYIPLLLDHLTGETWNILEAPHDFNVQNSGTLHDRFSIVFARSQSPTYIAAEASQKRLRITEQGKFWNIQNSKGFTEYHILDLNGRTLSKGFFRKDSRIKTIQKPSIIACTPVVIKLSGETREIFVKKVAGNCSDF